LLLSLSGTFGTIRPTPIAAQESAPCWDSATGGPTDLDTVSQDPRVAAVINGIAERVSTLRARSPAPSISIAVVHDQEPLFLGSFGCAVVPETDATPDESSMIGSITKIFTDTMLMQLRDAGKLDLDDPVDRYVPEVVYLAPDGRLISPTFRQLAQHRAGLPRDMSPPPATPSELFARLPRVRALWHPGDGFSYSNLGVATLARALAVIAGEPYEQYIDAHILAPLGMSHSGFFAAATPQPWLATGYQGPAQRPVPLPAGNAMSGAGFLWSSAADMARFIALQFRDAPADGDAVLSGASLREMWTDTAPTGGNGRIGLGWFVTARQGETVYMHNGAVAGFRADLKIAPELKLGVHVQINWNAGNDVASARPESLGTAILDALIPAMRAATRP